jgi:hypothetical protein
VIGEAARILRTEVAFVQKAAVTHAADADAFAVAVTAFYASHAGYVSRVLVLTPAEADRYCAGQAAQIVAGDWLRAVEVWRTDDYAAGLAAIALDEEAA